MISSKHANFIVNYKDATADDIKYLKPKKLYRVVNEDALKVLKDTIYRKHMLHAEGRYPLKSELEPKTTKKKKS